MDITTYTNISRLNSSITYKIIKMEITRKSGYTFFIWDITETSRQRKVQSKSLKRKLYLAHSKQNKEDEMDYKLQTSLEIKRITIC